MTFCSKNGLTHNTAICSNLDVQLNAAGEIPENQTEPNAREKKGYLDFSKRKLFGGVILGILAILLGFGSVSAS